VKDKPVETAHQQILTDSEGKRIDPGYSPTRLFGGSEGEPIDEDDGSTVDIGGADGEAMDVDGAGGEGPDSDTERHGSDDPAGTKKCMACDAEFWKVYMEIEGTRRVCVLCAVKLSLAECCGVPEGTDCTKADIQIKMGAYEALPSGRHTGLCGIKQQVVDMMHRIKGFHHTTTRAFHVYVVDTSEPYPSNDMMDWYTALMIEMCLCLGSGSIGFDEAIQQLKSLPPWDKEGPEVWDYVIDAWKSYMHECALVGVSIHAPEEMPHIDTSATKQQVQDDFDDALETLRGALYEKWRAGIEAKREEDVRKIKLKFPRKSEYDPKLKALTAEMEATLASGPNAASLAYFAGLIDKERKFQKYIFNHPAFSLINEGMVSGIKALYEKYMWVVRKEGTDEIRWDAMITGLRVVLHEIAADHVGRQGNGFESRNPRILAFVRNVLDYVCDAVGMPRTAVAFLNNPTIEKLDMHRDPDPCNELFVMFGAEPDVHTLITDVRTILKDAHRQIFACIMEGIPAIDSAPLPASPAAVRGHPNRAPVAFKFLPPSMRGPCNPQLAQLSASVTNLLNDVANPSTRIPGLQTMTMRYLMEAIREGTAKLEGIEREHEVKWLSKMAMLFIGWVLNATIAAVIGIVHGPPTEEILVKRIEDFTVDDYNQLMEHEVFLPIMRAAFKESSVTQEVVILDLSD